MPRIGQGATPKPLPEGKGAKPTGGAKPGSFSMEIVLDSQETPRWARVYVRHHSTGGAMGLVAWGVIPISGLDTFESLGEIRLPITFRDSRAGANPDAQRMARWHHERTVRGEPVAWEEVP